MLGVKARSETLARTEWEEPNNAESLKSDLQVPGRGLGQIHPSRFETATWIPRINLHDGQQQFGKFVDAMMNRIRFEESNPEEVRQFVKLIASDENWIFLWVAVPRIPELKLDHLHENDNKNFQLALLFQQLKSKIHQRSFEEVKVKTEWGYYHQPRAKPFSHTLPSSKGLTKAEQAYFEQSLFSHYSGPRKIPAMERLLKGTLALGWHLPALDRQQQDARKYGIRVERDSEGLPMYMLMPGQPRARGIWPLRNPSPASTANTSAASSQMASPSMAQASPTTSQDDQGNDSPPCELLTELNVVADAGPSVGKRKSKMIYTNVPQVFVTSASSSSTAYQTNVPVDAEVPNSSVPNQRETQAKSVKSKVASGKMTSPELEYIRKLPTVPNTAPPKGPIYPNIPLEPTIVLPTLKQDYYEYMFYYAQNYFPFIRLCYHIARTNHMSRVIEADAKAMRLHSVQALRLQRRPEMVGECTKVVVATRHGWKTYYSPLHTKYRGVTQECLEGHMDVRGSAKGSENAMLIFNSCLRTDAMGDGTDGSALLALIFLTAL